MDGRSRYAKIHKVVEIIKDMETITLPKLRRIIYMEVGSSEKLVGSVMGTMVEMGFIKEIDNMIYQVN